MCLNIEITQKKCDDRYRVTFPRFAGLNFIAILTENKVNHVTIDMGSKLYLLNKNKVLISDSYVSLVISIRMYESPVIGMESPPRAASSRNLKIFKDFRP